MVLVCTGHDRQTLCDIASHHSVRSHTQALDRFIDVTFRNAKMYLPHLGTTNSFWTPETLPHPRIAKCQCGQVTYTAPKGMVPLEFATLSQTGESVELDSVLGPIGPGYQEIDLASYKTEEDTEYSWWAGSLKIHSLDMLRDTKSVEDSKSSRRKSSASAPS